MAELPVAGELEPPSPPSLFTWAVGSFHTASLVALGVAGLHLSGAAGDLLGGLGTLPGAVAYLYLWGLTVATTGRALRRCGVSPLGGVSDARAAATAALLWAAATGLLVFASGFLVAVVAALVVVGVETLVLLAVVGGVGVVLATVVGGVVGGLFAALDVALLRAATLVAGAERRPEPAERPSDDR